MTQNERARELKHYLEGLVARILSPEDYIVYDRCKCGFEVENFGEDECPKCGSKLTALNSEEEVKEKAYMNLYDHFSKKEVK